MWGFILAIGSAIWQGIQVAAKITLTVLQWIVANLSLLLTKTINGLAAVGHFIMVGLKDVWAFTRKLYDDILKPAFSKLWGWFQKFEKWLDDTFGPVLRFLKRIRDNLLLFYKTFVRPWLDLIDVTRKLLHVFSSLGLAWATALDKKLGELETAIEKPFRLVLSKLNEVIGIVNRIVTLDGLIQRVALVKSLGRDYKFAWRAISQPYTRAVTDDDRVQATTALGVKPLGQIESETRTYIRDGSGPRAALLDEMAIIWRKQLRES